MATIVNCTHEGQYYNNSAWGTFNKNQACYVGTNANGANVTVIKFTTPSFSGVSSEVTISFPTVGIGGVYSELYYALCTSDANAMSYLGTTSSTPSPESIVDEYRITTGTIDRFYPGDQVTFTINTSELQPNTAYYIILWGQNTWSRAQINTNITETLAYEEIRGVVYIGDDTTHNEHTVYIADIENPNGSSIPVKISNVGARGIFRQNGAISYNSNWNVIQTLVGYYSSPSTNYAMQLRFRLNKPCTSIRLCVQGASGSEGTYYFKVSSNVQDDALLNRMFDQGHTSEDTPVSIAWDGTSYYGEGTIEGDFPADTDLYIYCYRYSTSHNAVHLFGLYDSGRYSKVIEATAVAGTEEKMCSFGRYTAYIGDGTNWVPYNG